MNRDEAIKVLQAAAPCAHVNWTGAPSDRWLKCQDCGDTFSRDSMERRAGGGARFQRALDVLAGGCARDQRTTQFCAEAVARDEEIHRLTAALAAARPVVEWVDGCAQLGIFRLVVHRQGGWALMLAPRGIGAMSPKDVTFGPETGDAGKAACYAAWLRACGL